MVSMYVSKYTNTLHPGAVEALSKYVSGAWAWRYPCTLCRSILMNRFTHGHGCMWHCRLGLKGGGVRLQGTVFSVGPEVLISYMWHAAGWQLAGCAL